MTSYYAQVFVILFMYTFIGWFTNVIAIWALFRPKLKKFGLQGVIPKRRKQFSEGIADGIVTHLLSHETLIREVLNVDDIPQEKYRTVVNNIVERMMLDSLSEKEKQDTVMFEIRKNSVKDMARTFSENLDVKGIINAEVISMLKDHSASTFDLKKLLVSNMDALDLDTLETIVKKVAKVEFRAIEIIGGVIGFILGALQILIFGIN